MFYGQFLVIRCTTKGRKVGALKLVSSRDRLQNKVLLRELLAVEAVEIIKESVFAHEAREYFEF